VAETDTVTYCLGTVCHVQTASYSRGRTELPTRTAPDRLWSVGNVGQGEFHADNTVCKYFNANFIVLFHMFLFLGNCPSWAVIGI
jgi:hypothetical protein